MMERRVKERLIGASLLVALIVLIVPEMLSGPTRPSARPLTEGLPAPTRSVSVDLSTSQATTEPDMAESASAAAASSGAAASDAAPGGSAAAGGSAASGASSTAGSAGDTDEGNGEAPANHGPPAPPSVSTLKAQPSSGSALETSPSPPRSTAGGSRTEASGETAGAQGRRGWSVQLGSFASRANAEKLIHQVQARGGSSLYVSSSGSGPSLRYRVRVGPYADRAAAERSAGKLKAAGHSATLVGPAS